MSYKLKDNSNKKLIFCSSNDFKKDYFFEFCTVFTDQDSNVDIFVPDSLYQDFILNHDVIFPDGCNYCTNRNCNECPYL